MRPPSTLTGLAWAGAARSARAAIAPILVSILAMLPSFHRRCPVPVAIQDQIPHNHCWGCGTLNPRGLRIKSFVEGDEAVCTFQPSPDFMAGPTNVLYGGILAAVIDCHTVCTAIAHSYRAA